MLFSSTPSESMTTSKLMREALYAELRHAYGDSAVVAVIYRLGINLSSDSDIS